MTYNIDGKKRIICVLLCLCILSCSFLTPVESHALVPELLETVSLGSAAGAAAPVILAILGGAGLAVGVSGAVQPMIDEFYSSLDATQKAEVDNLGRDYIAQLNLMAASGSIKAVPIKMSAVLVQAVSNFVTSHGRTTVVNGVTNYSINQLNPTGIGLSAVNYTVPDSQVNITIQADSIGSEYDLCSPAKILGTSMFFGVRCRRVSDALVEVYPALFDSAGKFITRVSESVAVLNVIQSALDTAPSLVGNVLSFRNSPTVTTGMSSALGNLATNVLAFTVALSEGANTIASAIGSIIITSNPALPYSNSRPVPVPSLPVINTYPFLNPPASLEDFEPIPDIDLTTTMQRIEELLNKTVYAPAPPLRGIEDGVALPGTDKELWTDFVANLGHAQYLDPSQTVAPPIDTGNTLTWPTTHTGTLNPAIPDAWAPSVPDIAVPDISIPDIDTDGEGMDGNGLPWAFRIPILGTILEILYRIWQWLVTLFQNVVDFFRTLFYNLGNWLKAIFEGLRSIVSSLGTIISTLGQFLSELPSILLNIFMVVTGYTLFEALLDGFLPQVVVSVLWVFWMACMAIWLVRWLADR